MKTKEEYKKGTSDLMQIAHRKGIIDLKERNAYTTLSETDPEFVHKLACQRILKMGYSNLWRNHSDLMVQLSAINPALAKFVSRAAVKLSVADEEKKFKRAIEAVGEGKILKPQVKNLVDLANRDNLITLDESLVYLDLIDWEEINYEFVEHDILRKVLKYSYKEFKDKAPNVLGYVKSYYHDWYDMIIKPYQESVKNGLNKDNK